MSDIELIKCPACGREVSNQAVSCPHCGQPIMEMVKEKEREEEAKQIARYSQIEEYGKSRSKKKGGFNVGCLIIIGMFVVAMIVAVAFPNNKRASETINNSEQQSEANTKNDDEYNYKSMVERYIKDAYPDAKFDFVMNYRTWSDGTFTMVENQFKIGDVKHKYVARCGGGKLFHLTIDDEKVYYDEEGQWDYMSNNE